MPALRRFCLGGCLLALLVIGCDSSKVLEPTIQPASSLSSGSTLIPPSSVQAIPASPNRIDVSWKDNSSNETGFEVHRSIAGVSGAFALRASTASGVATYSDVGLNPSSQYCYKTRAFRTSVGRLSYSGFSVAACATTKAPPTGALQITVVTTGSDVDSDGYDLGIDARPLQRIGINGVTLVADLAPGFHTVTLSDVATNCVLNGANPRSIEVRGGSTGALRFDATCSPFGPPAVPSNVSAEPHILGITVVWRDNSRNEDGFKIERCEGDEAACGDADFILVGTTGPNQWLDGYYYDEGLEPITYTYRVRSFNRAGDSAPSSEASGKPCDALSCF